MNGVTLLSMLLSFCLAPAQAQDPAQVAAAAAAAQPQLAAPMPGAPPTSPEKQALEKLQVENMTQREHLTQRLRKITEEREEAAQKYLLGQEKLRLLLADIEAQHRKLGLENALRDEKVRSDLRELEIRQRRLTMENALDPKRKLLDETVLDNQLEREKLVVKLRALSAEKDEAAMKYALLQEKLRLELADLETQQRKLALENALTDEKGKKELAELRQKREKLRLETELEKEKLGLEMVRFEREKSEMEVESRRLDLESRKMRFEQEKKDILTTALRTDLDLREKKEDWKSQANKEPDYVKEPFADGALTISDRRIPLNGPIVRGAADYVCERIDYYNNKSGDQPIFIVIDRSPGGSVMEGYRILKAMRASKAPVIVVVRSFAASMAAIITTMAPRSYAYPNAVILHHQVSAFMMGNMTQMKEALEIANEWYRRVGTPVAEKMGLSLDGFTKEMYKHNSDGDWEEFADKASKLKWVDAIVHEIRETGILKDPDKVSPTRRSFEEREDVDSKGQRFVRLPRLEPFDVYYLYNRDGYYR